jgi:hypothetical protein
MHDGRHGEAKLVTRLYQWLHDRATAFRGQTLDSRPQRTVRTEVTVREQTLLLAGLPLSGDCPLCGQAVGPGGLHGAMVSGGRVPHVQCANPPGEAFASNETQHVKKELP